MPKKETLIVFTDGACQHNPGPGGWGAYILDYTQEKKYFLWGGVCQSTNNKMELQGPLEALFFVGKTHGFSRNVVIFSDSQYVVKGITQWIHNWCRNGWRTAGKKDVENQDLWRALQEESQKFLSLSWQWVRGHDESQENAVAHDLAQKGMKAQNQGLLVEPFHGKDRENFVKIFQDI